MLYREIMAVCSEIHTKHINTLCGQNVEFFYSEPDCNYSNHWAWIVKWMQHLDGRHENLGLGKVQNPNKLRVTLWNFK